MLNPHRFFRAGPRGEDDPVFGHWYECASDDPDEPQAWCYTDSLSYAPGDTLRLHANATAGQLVLDVARDGLLHEPVLWAVDVKADFHATPADCSVSGCGWPVVFEMTVPADWRPGAYIVTCRLSGGEVAGQYLFFVRAAATGRHSRTLMLVTTSTWLAYNDWGGSNHYEGLTGANGDAFSPRVSLDRPWARGFVSLPADAPRVPHASLPGGAPRYPHMEWAHAHGYSKKYASSGWASYERHFVRWAEAQGATLDFATQHDLHADPNLLGHYACVVIVGHDEYWSWTMRDALDGWLDAGGHLARFAGNFYWQVRIENEGRQQVCYKYTALAADPLRDGADSHLTTTCWDAAVTGRPAASSMGLTGSAGIYAGWSRCAANGAGGFTVYRPDHWALTGAGLGYGDVLGAHARVFGYEVDGMDYLIRNGLPEVAPACATAAATEVIALAPATTVEAGLADDGEPRFIAEDDARMVAEALHGEATPGTVDRVSRGVGMMAEYRRGKGVVFNAGSCEWVAGLVAGDAQVERITANVLKRFSSPLTTSVLKP